MTRLTPFVPNEYYHVYNRGANKMVIFKNNSDYERFQKLLYIVNSKETNKFSDLIKSPLSIWKRKRGETLVDIGVYCLMPNHFHLLIKIKNKNNAIIFLQRLQLSYSKYFNIKYNRSGVLFQGKYKARHITKNNDLKYNFSYIHLNPVKLIIKKWKEIKLEKNNRIGKYLSLYKYSSYIDFLEIKRPELKIINRGSFPNYFKTPTLFKKEIFDWLNNNKNEYK